MYYLQVVLVTQSRKKAEAANEKLAEEKAALEEILAQGDTAVREMEGKMRKVEAEKKALDAKVSSERAPARERSMVMQMVRRRDLRGEGDSWQAIILLPRRPSPALR